MNIIARAALYLYDGSQAAPIFPDKVGKPGDEAAAYLSTVADKLMASKAARPAWSQAARRRRCCAASSSRRFRRRRTR